MQLSRLERAAIIADLKAIATRLAGAPAHTEELARTHTARYRATLKDGDLAQHVTHHPHQVGGLEQVCTSSARDLEAIIRRLGGGS